MPEATTLVSRRRVPSAATFWMGSSPEESHPRRSPRSVGTSRAWRNFAAAAFGVAAIDLSDSAGIAELVSGHSDIVLISGGDSDRLTQHMSVIEAAKNADACHVYHTSGVRADDGRFEISGNGATVLPFEASENLPTPPSVRTQIEVAARLNVIRYARAARAAV